MKDSEVISKIKALHHRRAANGEFRGLLREYYEKRLALRLGGEVEDALSSEDTIVIEASHGAQLGHLGIHRLYLKGAQLARRIGNAVMLFLVGDQYQPVMYPEINRVYFPKCGRRGTPFTLLIKKQDRRRPLYDIPPPSEKSILRLKNQMLGLFGPNFHHFCTLHGIDKKHADRSFFRENLEYVTEVLIESASKTENYADWVTRSQIVLLSRVFPELFERHLVFFPISMLRCLPEFPDLLEKVEEVNEHKLGVSRLQKLRGETPYLSRRIPLNLSPFWYHCPECSSRNRGLLSDGEASYTCTTCGAEVVQKIEEGFSNPDIVFSQILTPVAMGTTARIVGHVHPYAEVADGYLSKKLGIPPPERLLLGTFPVFHGLGDADGGDTRCSLIRALLEAEQGELRKLAYDDWSSCPEIYSYYYRYVSLKGEQP
ncbi:MAG: hypothetical protein GXO66_09110 [Euryarchaeota archaeon]|nr:hypothetical protein [Euryarchaeota archaeon]